VRSVPGEDGVIKPVSRRLAFWHVGRVRPPQ
jgi:hypothetical protein